MRKQLRHLPYGILALLIALLASLLPAQRLQAQPPSITTELIATADARVQGGSPDANFGSGFIWVGTPNGHLAFVQFDLLQLPANATISNAELRLNFTGTYTESATVEVGLATSAWDEATVTWNTRPTTVFNGTTQPVGAAAGEIVWTVTPAVAQWHSGSAPNNGFALRGDGPLKAFHSRETIAATPPRLVVTYSVPPEEGPRPDLGDAPDSSNSLGITPNTAYPGTPGNFPTVFAGTPAGQPAGPRHANATPGGFLGQVLSREAQADSGPDQDGPNNILNGGADNADNDRGDDGWRNRNVGFDHCAQTTLTIRVSKASGATLDRMFLNVWFDGTHDGDWNDRALCTPEDAELATPATEWIVQDYYVDLTGIPAGGSVDITVNTETVLNLTPERRHWMRFTLSERQAVQTANGRADGRGPHPDVAPQGFQHGETEDILQRPQPPGEPGELQIEKRVIGADTPVPYAGTVTYEIRMRHVGGSEPLQAQLRDLIAYPQHILPQLVGGEAVYVDVSSPTGGVSPLAAQLSYAQSGPASQIVNWSGTLHPNAEVRFSFNVHVHPLCNLNQQTATVGNSAQVRARGGIELSAEAGFVAQCPGYDSGQIEFEPIENPVEPGDLNDTPWNVEVWNRHDFPVDLGIYLPDGATANDETAGPTRTVVLEADERRTISVAFPLADNTANPLDQIGDAEAIPVRFCFLLPEQGICPDAAEHPNYHGDAPPFNPGARSNDLGDAPDSTNHAGAAMAAYPGTPAAFPTVFDPATGMPQGPRHTTPRPFHLGERVSLEGEADVGPDQDPLHNIEPAANDPDNDRADDGARLTNLAQCQPATAEVLVFISPQALAWFQQAEQPAYLNAWIDGNRDGDWADGAQCPNGPPALEHILIDQPIDVAALGVGLHTLTFATGPAPWPAQLAERPTWVRFTLSEREASKPLQFGAIAHGDGRGYATPFRTGETEDYLRRAAGDPDAAPDLGVNLRGRIGRGGANGNDRVSLAIDYANVGSAPASGGSLRLSKPQQLRDLELVLTHASDLPAQAVNEAAETVTIQLPALAPGDEGRILLAWDAPGDQAPLGDYAATLTAVLSGDANPANNEASATLTRPAPPLRLAIEAGDGSLWGLAETTCRDFIRFPGQSALGTLYDFVIDATVDHTFVAGVSPWTKAHADMAEGRHEIWFAPTGASDPTERSNSVRLNVNPGLPIDPLSLTFTDSQGRSYHPPTWNWGRFGRSLDVHLRDGETYELAITSCSDALNQQLDLILPTGDTIRLTDEDSDGRYSGSFVFEASEASMRIAQNEPTTLQLAVRANGIEQRFAMAVEPLDDGVVRDLRTGRALADVALTALEPGMDGNPLLPAATGGAPTQTSDAEGRYAFNTLGGALRLLATRPGYQPYRTWDIATPTGVLAAELPLTPVIAGAPDHTVTITANGFSPATLAVAPGDVIEWVNLDTRERGVRGDGIDSGALAPGASYRAQLNTAGRITVTEGADAQLTGVVTIDGQADGYRLFLPIVRR